MKKIDFYRQTLRSLEDWEPYLLEQSGLPGPRANIELGRAVSLEGNAESFEAYLENDPEAAPTNSPREFLVFCGVLGLGRLLAEGERERLANLRKLACDPRWRVREAVAMALQEFGRADMDSLLEEAERWAAGSPYERRAAAAGLCEPNLLTDERVVSAALDILNRITRSLKKETERNSAEFKALRKGLGYCWSVAICAYPELGKRMFASWCKDEDKDIRWVVKQNLAKKRLQRLDKDWVDDMRRFLSN